MNHNDHRPPTTPATPDSPRRRGPRPVPPGVEYHRVLAGEKRRIGRGILAIVLLVAGMFVFNITIALASGFIDTQMGNTNPTQGGTDYTPLHHGATLFSIALLIPWSMVIQRWLYGVRGPSLHSVVSRFRFDIFGRSLLIIGPIWLIPSLIVLNSLPMDETQWASAALIGVFVVSLLMTPLQSAGEEYGFRGLVFRIAGSWGRGPRTALVTGVLVSSLVFTVVHFSPDPWFNLWCFTLGASLAVITWRTGGIEIAVVVHALNNTLLYLFAAVLHADFNVLLERAVGAYSVALLAPCAVVVAIAVVVWVRTRKTGPALTPAPAQAHLDARPAQVTTAPWRP